jgi:hypothetical protein
MCWYVRGGISGKVELRVTRELAIACFNEDHSLLTWLDVRDRQRTLCTKPLISIRFVCKLAEQ